MGCRLLSRHVEPRYGPGGYCTEQSRRPRVPIALLVDSSAQEVRRHSVHGTEWDPPPPRHYIIWTHYIRAA